MGNVSNPGSLLSNRVKTSSNPYTLSENSLKNW